MLHTLVEVINTRSCTQKMKIALISLTPAEIVQCHKELAENRNNRHALDSGKTPKQLALN